MQIFAATPRRTTLPQATPATSSATSSGKGCYRRRIILTAAAGSVLAAIEDDYHHFLLKLDHDGTRVTGISADAKRFPWLTCPSASQNLERLIGTALSNDVLATNACLDAHHQCTHQFDLALAAILQAVRGGTRQYDAMVTDPVDGVSVAVLTLDGITQLTWELQGSAIIGPQEYAGINLRKIDIRTLARQEPEQALAISLLRRAVMVAGGRGVDFDQFEDMSAFAERMAGACHAFQPERIPFGKRSKGSMRDFSNSADRLLHDFRSTAPTPPVIDPD